MLRLRSCAPIALLSLCSVFLMAKEPKLTTEELVQKSLDAIGTPEARAQKSRRLSGTIEFRRMSNSGMRVHGSVALLTITPNQLRFLAKFNANNYQQEDFTFDGTKVNIAFIDASGVRSRFGDFIYEHESVLREGLFGGPLSIADPLADLNAHQVKLHYDGLKKVDGRQVHQVSYYPHKNSDSLIIKLFFEPETFRHVKTIYSWDKPVGMASSDIANARMPRYYYELEERFSEFRTVQGLTLPASWGIRLNTDENGAGYAYEIKFDHCNDVEIPAGNAAEGSK